MKKITLLLLIFLCVSTASIAAEYKNKAYIIVDAKYPVNVTYQVCSLDVGFIVNSEGKCSAENSTVFSVGSPALEIQKGSLEFVKITQATINAGPTNNAKSLLIFENGDTLHTTSSSACKGTIIILSDHGDRDTHITCSAS